MTRRRAWMIFPLLVLVAAAPRAFAHAVLVHSTPADQAIVQGPNVTLTLDYNSRIDAARSTLTLTGPAGNILPLQREPDAKAFELHAQAAGLASGIYHIHWQVLASDGHITRGDIAFTVGSR